MNFQFKVKLGELNTQSIVLLGALVALGVVLGIIAAQKKKWTARMLSHGAVCIALSFVLSYIRLLKMPQGGSVTAVSMLPVMAFSYLYGVGPGLLVGICYGLLQLVQNPEILGLAQVLLDYPLAFGCLGLAGLGRKLIPGDKNGNGWKDYLRWALGTFLAALGRYLCSALSGLVFFAEYAAGSGYSPLVYTLLYNGVILVEWGLCLVVLIPPTLRKNLEKMAKGK